MPRKKTLRDDLRFAFRAFESRNYRVLFWPQSISTCGAWMQNTALGWLVYRLTESPAWLGFVTFLTLFPIFVLSLWAGVFGDRYPRQRILWMTNLGSFCLSVSLALLAFGGAITPEKIAFIALLQGLLNAVEIPTRQAFVLDLVSHANLQSAVALNSSVFNMARLLGPMAAGAAIDASGESLCFLLAALLRLPILTAIPFLAVERPLAGDDRAGGNLWRDLKTGLRYVRRSRELSALMQMIASLSFLGIWFPSFLPAVAKDVLLGGPMVLGFLYGATGCGSFVGAYLLARSGSPERTGPRVARASVAFSALLFLFSRTTSTWTAFAVLFLLGLSTVVQNVGANTLVQLLSPNPLRGRITSVYTVALLGVGPLGVLLAGGVAEWIGIERTLALAGFGCLVVSLFYARDVDRVTPPTGRRHLD